MSLSSARSIQSNDSTLPYVSQPDQSTPMTVPYHMSLSSARSIQSKTPILSFEDQFFCCPPFCSYVFQVVSFPQVTPQKPCMHFSCPPYVAHALPISFFFDLTHSKYLLRSMNRKAPLYAISSSSQISSPARYCSTPLSTLNVREQVSCTCKTTTRITVWYVLIFILG